MNNPDDWQILEINSLFKNPYIEVFQERVILPGEVRTRDWTVVRRKQAVVIAPLTSEGNFVLIHQARIPVRKILWEFPAGQIDDSFEPGMEMIRETALRELTEETGYSLVCRRGIDLSGTLLFIARILRRNASSVFGPACPSNRIWTKTRTIANQSWRCREFSLKDLRSMIADSVIQDANTLALFARLSAKKLIP